jgi:predicted metalloprotease with PDZ domain
MNTSTRKIAFALVAGLVAAAFTASPASAEPKALLLSPGADPGFVPQPLPKFGFASFNIHGFGERVTHVRWGGLASQFGLERGDTILSLNGFPLTYHGSWNEALSEAMYTSGGVVRLRIRDWRTGMVVSRQMFVGGGYGPITPKIHTGNPGGPTTKKMIVNPHEDNNTPKLNKKIVQLLDQ